MILLRKSEASNFFRCVFQGSAVAGLFLFFCCAQQVLAKESNPFKLDEDNWSSFDRYMEKSDRFPNLMPAPEILDETVDETPPVAEEAVKQETAAVEPQPPLPAEEPVPTIRPLKFSLLPGPAQPFDVQVGPTDNGDDPNIMKMAEPERPLNLPPMPAIKGEGGTGQEQRVVADTSSNASSDGPEENKWEDAKTAARQLGKVEKEDEGEVSNALNVRLVGLPNGNVKPIPAGPATKEKKLAQTKTKSPTSAVAKSEKETAHSPKTCEALTNYKKRQLAAIESDRRTLAALQKAIADLGLDGKLDYMTVASEKSDAKTDVKESEQQTEPPAASLPPQATAKN